MSEPANTDKSLVRIYNDVDSFLRTKVEDGNHLDHVALLKEAASSNPVVARHLHEMRSLAQLRNTIVHNPFGAEAVPLVSPNQIVVDRYKQIYQSLKNPPEALNVAVPASKIYTCSADDRLMKVLKKMDENIFTHVPVMREGEMVGLLSENALLSYVADMEDVIIDSATKVNSLEKYYPLDKHRGEVFKFVPRHASLEEVFTQFNASIKKRERIGMLFITEHGKKAEKPLGIITAWDLANFEFESLI